MRSRGFTIIELFVSLTILLVLFSVVFPSIAKYQRAGRQQALDIEYQIIAASTVAYIVDNGTLPATAEILHNRGYLQSQPVLADYLISRDGLVIQIPK